MAIITGSASSEKFNLFGKYVWNGTSWVLVSPLGTTSSGDIVQAGSGNDEVDGGGGNDTISGESGNDRLMGGADNDVVDGGSGDDTIYGGTAEPNSTGSGNDTLSGGSGQDTILGGDGNDTLDGGSGDDVLLGEAGNDSIDGGSGADLLTGGAGADTLAGGSGGDTFLYNAVADSQAGSDFKFNNATGDVISGFESAAENANAALRDKIDLTGLVSSSGHALTWGNKTAGAYKVWYEVSGGNTFVSADTTGDGKADLVIKMSGTETLSAADFIGLSAADNVAPVVTAVAYGGNDGTLKAGESITLTVTFSEAVIVASGTPTMSLNSGGTATYTGGSGTNTLTFRYDVAAGQNSADLASTALNLGTATIKDAAGNNANLSGAVANPPTIVVVDTLAPAAPGVALTLDSGNPSDGVTNNGALSHTGVETNATVEYSIDNGASWSSSFTATEGLNTIKVHQIDKAGNVSAAKDFSFTLDTQAPAAPGVALTLNSGDPSDGVTNNGALSHTGVETDATVEYSTDNGTNWSSSFTATEGLNTIKVHQIDKAGNVSAATDFTFTLDTGEPEAPVITGFSEDTGIPDNGVTTVTMLSIAGTAEAHATVAVYDNDVLLGTTTAGVDGTWTFETDPLTPLTQSVHNFTATATDLAGNESDASEILQVEVVEAITGAGIDGYIAGATVFADADGDGILDAGEVSTTTDGTGNFTLEGGSGKLVLVGGTDISTGQAFTGTLRAPEGASTITPLTTLVVAVAAANGISDAEAQTAVIDALGLDPAIGDLGNFDPIAAALSSDEAVAAIGAQAAAAAITIQNTIIQGSALLAGAGVDPAAAEAAMLQALTSHIGGEAGPLDLTDTAILTQIVTDAAEEVAPGELDQATIDGAVTVIGAVNEVVAEAAAGSSGAELLTSLAQVQIVVQTEVAASLTEAGQNNDASNAVSNFTGEALADAVDAAADQVGDIDGGTVGTAGDDILTGGAASDAIDGLAGNDTISGEGGNDILIGGEGDDTLTGGAGVDTYVWREGDGYDTVLSAGSGSSEDVIRIEGTFYDYNWSVAGDDLIVGVTADGTYDFANVGGSLRLENFLSGNDSIAYLEVDLGPDNNNFYSPGGGDARIYLSAVTGTNQGNYFETIIGTSGDDMMSDAGGTGGHWFAGRDGDDTITVASGTSAGMAGGNGNDTLRGAELADDLRGGAGNDLMDGGDGIDRATYNRPADSSQVISGAFVNLSGADATYDFNGTETTIDAGTAIDNWGGIDTLLNIENVRGSDFDDVLVGSDGDNNLQGLAGDDILAGGNGYDSLDGGSGVDVLDGGADDDWLDGGAGADTLIGGEGFDTADYEASGSGAFVNLSGEAATYDFNGNSTMVDGGTAIDNGGAVDTLLDIENVWGSNFDDVLVGSDGDNILDGLAGNDILAGGDGNDTLFGGDGDDVLEGGAGDEWLDGDAGADTLIGGDGVDIAAYAAPGSGAFVNLSGEAAAYDFNGALTIVSGGTAIDNNGDHDTLSGIEEVWGSNFDDVIIGTSGANTLHGNDGDDILIAGGNDAPNGGGFDFLHGGGGADSFVFGTETGDTHIEDFELGTDFLRFQGDVGIASVDEYNWGDPWGLTTVVTLTTGATVALVSVSGVGDVSQLLAPAIEGTTGPDTLAGTVFNDTFIGGTDDDTLTGGAGIDTYVWREGDGNDTILSTGSGGSEDIFRIEGTFYDFDWQYDGNDLLVGVVADDSYDFATTGGSMRVNDFFAGEDNISYLDVSTAYAGNMHVYFSLGTGVDQGDNLEVVLGTTGDDEMTDAGGSGFNALYGREGNDRITLAAGTSGSLNGGDGDDVLIGAQFSDQLRGSAGSDYMDGGDGGDYVRYNGLDGSPAVTSGAFVNISGQDATYTFNGVLTTVAGGKAIDPWGNIDTLVNIEGINGSDFDDVLVGNAGTNSLAGGAGHDILVSGGADDYLSGGLGADRFVFGANPVSAWVDDFAVGIDSLVLEGGVTIILTEEIDTNGDGSNDSTRVTLSSGEITLNGVTGVTDTADLLTQPIFGTAGADTLNGTTGNDILIGGKGDDTLTGDAGVDNYVWEEGDGYDTILSTGSGGSEDIIRIEGTFYDFDWQYSGNDLLVGVVADDTYDFATTGGSLRLKDFFLPGNDSLDYIEVDTGANNGFYSPDGGDARIYVSRVEGTDQGNYFEVILGTDDDDEMTDAGGLGWNQFHGRDGNDTITMAEGSFGSLNGGNGDDTLTGAELDDQLRGSAGNDLMDGGDGNDLVRYNGLDGSPETTLGAFVNLSGTDATYRFNGGDLTVGGGTAIDNWGNTDTLSNIENARGSAFDDVIVGTSGSNRLWGNGGNDILVGGGSDGDIDTLNGGGGADSFVFGTEAGVTLIEDFELGTDALRFQGDVGIASWENGDEITIVTLTTGAIVGLLGVSGVSDASELLAPAITGTTGPDTLDGTIFDDTLIGSEGDDTLIGGASIDTYIWREGDGYDTVLSTGSGGSEDIVRFEGTFYDFDWLIEGDDLVVGVVADDNYDFASTGGSLRFENFFTGPDTLAYLEVDVGDNNGFYSPDGGHARAYFSKTTGIDQGNYFESIMGTDGADEMTDAGGSGVNFFQGRGGDDIITVAAGSSGVLLGGDGDDTLTGADLDDTLRGAAGNDDMDGGDGIDLARYDRPSGSAPPIAGVFVNLSGEEATYDFKGGSETVAGGEAIDNYGDTDTLSNIENVWGSNFNDVLVGSDGDNELRGLAGNDTLVGGGGDDSLIGNEGNDILVGGAGYDFLTGDDGDDVLDGGADNDWLYGGQGADTLNGGDGFDTADYDASGLGVFVNLSDQAATYDFNGISTPVAAGTAIDNRGATDTLSDIEEVWGSNFDDVIVGTSGANSLHGNDGNDILVAGGNNAPNGGDLDALYGGDVDSLQGGGGADIFVFGAEAGVTFIEDFELGTDMLRFEGDVGIVSLVERNSDAFGSATVVTLSTGATIALVGVSGVSEASQIVAPITGTTGPDTLAGTAFSDTFIGGEGNDTITGGAGIDTYVWHEGDGYDTILSTGSGGSEDIVRFDGTFYDFDWLIEGNDLVVGVVADENYDFASTGGSLRFENFFTGPDTLAYLEVDVGDNNGFYSPDGGHARAYFSKTTGIDQGNYFESIMGTDAADDMTDVGGSGVNFFQGRGGDDIITVAVGSSGVLLGGDGDDTLTGANLDDTLRGAAGNDDMDGGDGIDLARYDRPSGSAPPAAGVFVNLSGEEATYDFHGAPTPVAAGTAIDNYGDTDTLSNIENAWGSGFNDVLVGSDGDNELRGLAGNDTLVGGGGDDSLIGNDGNDALAGGAGYDFLTGDDGDDVLDGGVDNDWLVGGQGADTLIGGDGFDTADYDAQGSGVFVNLSDDDATFDFNNVETTIAAGRAIDGGNANDTLSNIENVWGSEFDDVIVGTSGANELHGNDGNDILVAGGNESANGGDFDFLWGGSGADSFVFGSEAGATHIEDFELGTDVLQLQDGVTITGFEEFGGEGDTLTEVTLSSGAIVSLYGVSGAGDANDFLA